jgi:hypothetical protein
MVGYGKRETCYLRAKEVTKQGELFLCLTICFLHLVDLMGGCSYRRKLRSLSATSLPLCLFHLQMCDVSQDFLMMERSLRGQGKHKFC